MKQTRVFSFLLAAALCRMAFAQVDYHTDGGTIIKNDCVWEGRGTNKIGGLSDGMFDEWGFDIIRFCIDMKKSVHSDSYLQSAVNKAREHDAVIILTAFWYDNADLGGGTNWRPSQLLASTPTEDSRYGVVAARWAEIARLFKNRKDVWFGVWNEPYWWDGSHGYSEDQWLEDHRALTKIIRDEGADNIVVCQGSHMGQGHEVVINKGTELVEEFGNIVFDIHMYETRWTLSKEEIKNRIMDVRAKVPMMVGEFAIGNHHTHSTNWQDVIDACRETGTCCMYWLYGKEWSDRVDYVKAYCREERNTDCISPSEPVAPSIAAQPRSQTAAEGETATFTVQADGYPLDYQWKRDGQVIEGSTGASLSVGPVSEVDDGASFTVTISNEVGSVTSDPATLTVTPYEGLSIRGGEATVDGEGAEWSEVTANRLGNTACWGRFRTKAIFRQHSGSSGVNRVFSFWSRSPMTPPTTALPPITRTTASNSTSTAPTARPPATPPPTASTASPGTVRPSTRRAITRQGSSWHRAPPPMGTVWRSFYPGRRWARPPRPAISSGWTCMSVTMTAADAKASLPGRQPGMMPGRTRRCSGRHG